MMIREDVKAILIEEANKYHMSEENKEEIINKRKYFQIEFSKEKIAKLDKEHFFQGKGIKQGNYSDILTDGYIIRRQAVEFNVPVITNLELASALVRVLKQRDHNGTSIRSLNEYMDELSWKLW